MKGYSTIPSSSEVEPHQQMQFSVISRTLFFFREREEDAVGVI